MPVNELAPVRQASDFVNFYNALKYSNGEILDAADFVDACFTCGVYVDPFGQDLITLARAVTDPDVDLPTDKILEVATAPFTSFPPFHPKNDENKFSYFINSLPEGAIRERALAFGIIRRSMGWYEKELLFTIFGIELPGKLSDTAVFLYRYNDDHRGDLKPLLYCMQQVAGPHIDLIKQYLPEGYDWSPDKQIRKILEGHRVLIELMSSNAEFDLAGWLYEIGDASVGIQRNVMEGYLSENIDLSALRIAKHLGRRGLVIVRDGDVPKLVLNAENDI